MPVSNFDYDAILHPIFLMSTRKCFNYSRVNVRPVVEKFAVNLWKKMWKSIGDRSGNTYFYCLVEIADIRSELETFH